MSFDAILNQRVRVKRNFDSLNVISINMSETLDSWWR